MKISRWKCSDSVNKRRRRKSTCTFRSRTLPYQNQVMLRWITTSHINCALFPIMTRKTQQHVFTFVPVSGSPPLSSLPIVLECGFHHLLHSQSFHCLTWILRPSPLSFGIPTGPFAPFISLRAQTPYSLLCLIIEQENTIKPLSINLYLYLEPPFATYSISITTFESSTCHLPYP